MEVKLTYHGHACFTLEYRGAKAVIDPYAWGMVPGQPDLHLTANAVYCSHGHADHNFTQAVEIQETAPLPWTITEFETPHDECGGAKRGMNTVRILSLLHQSRSLNAEVLLRRTIHNQTQRVKLILLTLCWHNLYNIIQALNRHHHRREVVVAILPLAKYIQTDIYLAICLNLHH